MKRLALFALLLAALLLPAWAAAAAFPDAAACCRSEDITPIAPAQCTMPLPLQDGENAIACSGAYRVTGSCRGQLVVDVPGGDVFLLMDGVSITSPDGPAMYIKAAGKVILTLADGTQNTLTDSPVYTLPDGEDEPDGALFSKADLSINGTGTLQVKAHGDDGIVSKDSLVIAGADIIVDSRGDAIRGKDSVTLYRATIRAVSGKDGIKSTNDKDEGRGWICCLDSSLTIAAKEDGIQAETSLFISGGRCGITSGGGWSPENRQTVSAPVRKRDRAAAAEEEAEPDMDSGKGMKAGGITISGGTFAISSRDDAMHAKGSITMDGGDFELASNDDGIHADDTFTLNNGTVRITECYEGIEAAHILLRGGKTDITAIDDGWNAASKAASEAESGKRKKNHGFDITVSGGEHSILAGADAIDSNGSILISGGTTIAASSNDMKEAPIDYPEVCECVITGGTIVASGGYGRNTQTFSRAENQTCLLLKWKDEQPAGEAVTLKSEENVILTAAPKAPFKTLIVSTPALQEGQTLTVWQSDAPVCRRVISGSLMQFPVTPGKRTQSSRHGENGAAAADLPAKAAASGSMTACPASPASSELGYWLYTPAGETQERLALIVYLHGGSGKGSDLQRITDADGFPQYLQTGKLGDVRAYVVCPQCPENARGWQEAAQQVFALIDAVCAKYPIDTSRIILTGHSMGGTGTWALAALAPQRFSCIVPMSGSVTLTRRNQEALAKLPIWAFAAADDQVVDPASSADCISRLQAAGAQARLTVFEGAGHRDVPALAWLDEELGLLSWMLEQQRSISLAEGD